VETDRWNRIQQLYHAALQLPLSAREEFLSQSCANDAELRREVESLLAYEKQADELLENPEWKADTSSETVPSGTRAMAVGSQLGIFRIVDFLGAGGMGEVYRATDTRLHRDVAIKVLPAGLAREPERVARFEREARAAGALNHPNIVAVHDIGRDHDTYWIATELVIGEPLAKMIERGPVVVNRVLQIASQVADGLAAAHAAGIVHRDVKPANIMVTHDWRVKIVDFGLARRQRTSQDSTTMDMTDEGTVLGTAGYMSPEQVRRETVDHRSDLFSLGVVLHEMCSGKRAFSGASSIEVMNAVLKEQPAELPASVPPALALIVRRCLEKDPARRFQSAADLGFALQPSSPSLPPSAAPKRRSRLKWAAVASSSVLTLATLFWLTLPLPPPQITATVQLTNDGREKRPGLFTDGSRVFFMSDSAAGIEFHQVAVKEGGESITLPLPVKRAYLVDISPDRTELLLCRYANPDGTSCELWLAPLIGGAARRLGDLMAHNAAAAWSPDGQEVVYARDQELHIARIDGTEVRKLVTFSGMPLWLRWSPDGSRVRFSVIPGHGAAISLWEARIDGNLAYPLLPGWNASYACCGNWTPDGKYFVFHATVHQTVELWAIREKVGWFPRAERGPFQLTNSPLNMWTPVPSTDGKRLFVIGSRSRSEFLRYDLKSGQFAPALGGISGTEIEFSKDGKWVAYLSAPDGALWRAAVDGSQRLRLTSPTFDANLPHWSPDGKQITFFGARVPTQNATRIYVVSFDGGAINQVTNGESGKEGDADPSWSPDGASLAVGENPHSVTASSSIHVVDLKTGRVSVLPGSEGMWSPRWSPNGRFIAGLSEPGSKVVLYDLQTHKQSELTDVRGGYPSWSQDGEYLFYRTDGDDASWWRVRLRDRKAERIVALKNMQVDGWFAQAPNNSLITARLANPQEIYALDWKAP
jgi:serine/threonine protein kinase/Tol biopolymer transport system component